MVIAIQGNCLTLGFYFFQLNFWETITFSTFVLFTSSLYGFCKSHIDEQHLNIHVSSNVNEVIRAVLNFLFFFTKRFHKHKMHTSEQKQKRQHFYAHKKHLMRKKSLIRLFAFLCFLCFLCVQNLFVKKIKKVLNCPDDLTYITTKFILLLT